MNININKLRNHVDLVKSKIKEFYYKSIFLAKFSKITCQNVFNLSFSDKNVNKSCWHLYLHKPENYHGWSHITRDTHVRKIFVCLNECV